MADLTITFLGTGTSQGIPVIGCDCAVCTSADPRDTRTRSSLYLQTPECSWVIDTGPDFRAQCLREKVRVVDAVVYTHSHADHIMGFDDLRAFSPPGGMLPVYASPETMADIERTFLFAFNGLNRFPGYIHPEPRTIEGPFILGKIELTPLLAKHGRAHVFGYLFSKNGERLAAYLSDCKSVSDAVLERIAGVRHLIVDALRRKPHPTHMNVEEALLFSEKVGPGQTWFTHLCHDLAHAETEMMVPAGVRVAFDGMKIEI